MECIEVSEKAKLAGNVDVLVIGGGPAGLAAAVCAARTGAKTMLVEQNGYLGGMATAGLVGPFMSSYNPDGSRQIVKGFFEEFVRRMIAKGGAIHPSLCTAGTSYSSYITRGHHNVGPFDSEIFKLEAEDMCLKAGVELLYHAMFVKTLKSDSGLCGAVFAAKGGLLAVRAKILIDCTGDGDAAASAGAEMKQGRDGDGLTQPSTLFFQVSGIDKEKLEAHRKAHPEPDSRQFSTEVEKARSAGDFPIQREKLGMYESCGGVWRVNTTRMTKVDATNPFEISAAEIEGRKQVQIVMNFLRKYIPGGENARLLDSASMLGVRESRRIVGEYILNTDDIFAGKIFEDSIGIYGYPIDLHQPDGKAGEFILLSNSYSIPYRCLLPKTVDRLLVAGRCISVTHEALGTTRLIPACMMLGEAAGTAAALSVKEGISPKKLPYPKLREALLKGGAVLE